MNIAFIDYSLRTKSLDIYVSGCYGNCDGCHNPELFDFNLGEKYNRDYFEDKIKPYIESFPNMIENIMIFGGDPLDQDIDELVEILKYLSELNLKIWLFTRKLIIEIPFDIVDYCDYIKVGKYDKNQLVDDNIQYGIKLASKNQKIYKV